jgi:hypothetical protein
VLGVVLQIGLEPDATIKNEKFLLFASNNGTYQLVLEGSKNGEYASYEGKKVPVILGGDAKLLFSIKEEDNSSRGTKKVLKGKEIKPKN